MNINFSNCRGFPQPSEDDIKGMDQKLARDMMQLATNERERVLNDLHGVVDVEKEHEPPSFVATCLEKLEEELQKMKTGTAYLQAEMQSKEYVTTKNFRVMFLRADNFNAREAAARLIRYFEEKLNFFGMEKLTKDIKLSDLDKEDMACLRTGFIQILTRKDSSGRTVLAYLKALRPTYKQGVGRVIWYVISSLMEDEEIQKKGVVYVIHHVNAPVRETCLGLVILGVKMLYRTMPVKNIGTHLCTDSAAARPLTTAALNIMKSSERVRYRAHCGSHLECMYALRTFGILCFPADLHGNFTLEEHTRWYEARETKEKEQAVKEKRMNTIETISQSIGPTDVLFGRGAPVRDNPGNARFRKLVDRYIFQYENAERLEKGCIAYAIVVMVNESNGRFLHRSRDVGWAEVDATKARDKVHQTFRNVRHQK